MKMELMKKTLFLSIIALILSLSGCGIPTYYVPNSSDVSVNARDNTISLTRDMVNISLNKQGFPKLAFFYQIVPKEFESSFDSLVTYFSREKCNSYNSEKITSSNKGSAFYTKSISTTLDNESQTINYGLYQFTFDDNIIAFFDNANLFENQTNLTWSFDFNLSSEGLLYLDLTTTDSNSTLSTKQYSLKRFNDDFFNENTSSFISTGTESLKEISSDFSDQNITEFYLNIYALVTTEFNSYNNTYNSHLVEVESIRLN